MDRAAVVAVVTSDLELGQLLLKDRHQGANARLVADWWMACCSGDA
jgi:hypothetical protein